MVRAVRCGARVSSVIGKPDRAEETGLHAKATARLPLPKLRDRDQVSRLKVAKGTSGLALLDARSERVLAALVVAEDLLPLLADEEGQELLGLLPVRARRERARSRDVDHMAWVTRREEVLGRVDLRRTQLVQRSRYQ